jgi:hypothetical protein
MDILTANHDSHYVSFLMNNHKIIPITIFSIRFAEKTA